MSHSTKEKTPFFPNPFADYSPANSVDVFDGNTIRQDAKIKTALAEKWRSFESHIKQYTNSKDNATVYTGNTGIAMVKLFKYPNDPVTLSEIKNMVLNSRLRQKDCTFLCGDSGPLAVGAVVAHREGDVETTEKFIQSLIKMRADSVNIKSGFANEYLYGRAGYLYSLLYVNKHIKPQQIPDNNIREIIDVIFKAGKQLAKSTNSESPLMYEWNNSYYLGAAHGITGILYLLLQVTQYLTEEELNDLILPSIEYLYTLRYKSGNFPSSLGSQNDKYVQWCHGAPGFLYLFSIASKVFKNEEYLDIALKCGDIIWERGLLTKGYSLCHGVSGNAYCFLELYQSTKDLKHLYRAIKFTEWCIDYTESHELHLPDRPLSLYEGISGPMYLLLDIQNPMEAKFPGFTL